jgi:hypothetical protein
MQEPGKFLLKKIINATSPILSKYIRALKYPGTSEQEMFRITTTTEQKEVLPPCPGAGSR